MEDAERYINAVGCVLFEYAHSEAPASDGGFLIRADNSDPVSLNRPSFGNL